TLAEQDGRDEGVVVEAERSIHPFIEFAGSVHIAYRGPAALCPLIDTLLRLATACSSAPDLVALAANLEIELHPHGRFTMPNHVGYGVLAGVVSFRFAIERVQHAVENGRLADSVRPMQQPDRMFVKPKLLFGMAQEVLEVHAQRNHESPSGSRNCSASWSKAVRCGSSSFSRWRR